MPDTVHMKRGLDLVGGRAAGMPVARRVTIICGSLLRYDAISECALACLEAVASSGGPGVTVEVRIYCLESNIGDSRIHVVDSVQTLVAEPFFQASDIIIHHFGIVSPLHNALALAPRSAYVVIQFYGVTPPQFMPSALEGVISDSYIQIGLFEHADEIVVNSEYLASELGRIGIDKPMRRIELFGANIGLPAPDPTRRSTPDQLNVVYCGRFIESKQVLSLIEALDSLAADFSSLRLTLVGVANPSDGGYFADVRLRAEASALECVFELNRTAEQVVATIGAADLLVLPSLHEGFGMPVAEALAALTPVVCSDAGSLPEVAGGLALLFRSTDTASLTKSLHAALTARATGQVATESGRLPYAAWAARAAAFSAKYRRAAFVDRWRSAVVEMSSQIRPSRLSDTAHKDAIRHVFPDKAPHDSGEAQLLGRFVVLKALGRMNGDGDLSGTIGVLNRWAFGSPSEEQSEHDWKPDLSRCGDITELLAMLSSCNEVRTSTLRTRSLVGAYATLIEQATSQKPISVAKQNLAVPEMSRAEVEYVLKHSANPGEFIRAAYLMILGRDSDPGGLKDHIRKATSRDNWDSIIETFYTSEEYSLRFANSN